MRMMQLGALVAAVLAVLGLAGLPCTAEDDTEGAAKVEFATPWKAKTFINSDELTLDGLRGRLVFIEFFGTG